MGFSRQEYWSGLPFPSPGDLPNPEIKPVSLMSPALASGFFITRATWEAHKVVWYFHLFVNFPKFVIIHTVKGFLLVSEAETDVLLVPCFICNLMDVCNLISGSSAFYKPNLVHVLLKSSFNITMLACEISAII